MQLASAGRARANVERSRCDTESIGGGYQRPRRNCIAPVASGLVDGKQFCQSRSKRYCCCCCCYWLPYRSQPRVYCIAIARKHRHTELSNGREHFAHQVDAPTRRLSSDHGAKDLRLRSLRVSYLARIHAACRWHLEKWTDLMAAPAEKTRASFAILGVVPVREATEFNSTAAVTFEPAQYEQLPHTSVLPAGVHHGAACRCSAMPS